MKVSKEKVFVYLDELRESGVTNMYGAGPYVEDEFDVDRRTARSLVVEWMETFDKRHPREA
jgi:hypothetical protein